MGYKVSIIVTTYKRSGDFLIRAINSLLEQTYKNIEIIIIDDNNPNSLHRVETERCLQQFFKNTKIVYIKNEKNIGGALARNEGIKFSTGDYITFLDDDDKYLPEKVKRQLEFMVKYEYEMTFTELKIYNNKEKLVDYRKYAQIDNFDKTSLLKYHILRHITGTPTFMYKSDAIRRIGAFTDVKMGQEFYLMLKTIEKGIKIGYLELSDVVAYRHDCEGISMGKNKLEGEKALYDFKKKYFNILSLREKMFVRFRHHIVMAIASKRNKKPLWFFKHSLFAILSSPMDVVTECFMFVKRIVANKS